MTILLHNAEVLGEEGSYILIKGNRIEKIGRGEPAGATRKYDLDGASVFPGFCDSHTHLSNVALMHGTLDLTGKKREEVLNSIERECKRKKVIVGRGWDESFWDRREYLTSEELDSVCKGAIVFLVREDGHLAVVNSLAREKYGMGDENGIIREEEVGRMAKILGAFKNLDFEYAQNYALSKGITCIHDFAGRETLREYFRMHRRNELKIRIYANFYREAYDLIRELGLHSGFGDPFLKIGALKIFADGSIGAHTAATTYSDGKVVEPMLSREKIRAIVEEANSHGIRVFTHAIGDLAIEEVLAAYRGTRENRIEHFELAGEEHFRKEAEVSMQPNFLKWAKPQGLYHRMLGKKWLEKNNPYRKIIDSGMSMLFGSDCMPMDPLFGIKMAVESEYPAQRITFDEAIRAYTAGASYMHTLLGKIEKGAIADLVVVKDGTVEMTIVNGRILYTRKNLNV